MERLVDSAFLFLLLSTCCLGWPAVLRRSYNYAPQMMSDPMENQWEFAQAPTFDEPQDYYDPNTEYELAKLMDYYDDNSNALPIWGHIVNEKPESELEELKTISNHYEGNNKVERFEKKSIASSVAPPMAITTTRSSLENQLKAEAKAESHRVGQKEIPLLRPPVVKGKEAIEPVITQRAIEKKPSPLDTLRRMMSIEDNLIKEVEKRRETPTRVQKKRNFVQNEDQLTGQLNNLKKAMF